MRAFRSKSVFVAAVSLFVLIVGCDSLDQEARRIMGDQGLTLLQPARSYIALGGIVTFDGHKFLYEDPYDTLPEGNGTYSPFNAIISQRTRNKSMGIDAAFGSLGNFVTLPFSASAAVNHSSSVKLSQVDTGGTRYTTQKIDALLTKDATKKAIESDLQGQLRVFVIQEVYTATSFTITSSNSTSIAAAAGGSAPSPQCSPTGSGNSSSGGSSSGGSSSGGSSSGGSSSAGSGSGGAQSGGSGSRGSSSGGSSSPGSGSGGAQSAGSGSGTGSGSGGSGSAPISLGFCWAGNSSLSFTSQNPIPFAVRLNEVEVGPGGVLQVKKKDFKLPSNTLGENSVSNTATVPSNVMPELERKPRN